ncbi:unnamed protein product, partial [Polarella glacialis]
LLAQKLAAAGAADAPRVLAGLALEGSQEGLFRARAMDCLAKVLRASGARVVLSSAWRTFPGGPEAINQVMRKWGLPPIQSSTTAQGEWRVEQIWSWLALHREEVEGYAVLDDMDLSEEPERRGGFGTKPSRICSHCVRTPSTTGLTSAHISRLLAKLQQPPALPSPE